MLSTTNLFRIVRLASFCCRVYFSRRAWADDQRGHAGILRKQDPPNSRQQLLRLPYQLALGGLRLDSLEAMIKGGKRGPSIVPGDPENSLLIKAVRQTDPALKMPYGGKLKDAEIADLEAWVKAGAAWPASTASRRDRRQDGKYVISPERRNFWSILPLRPRRRPP